MLVGARSSCWPGLAPWPLPGGERACRELRAAKCVRGLHGRQACQAGQSNVGRLDITLAPNLKCGLGRCAADARRRLRVEDPADIGFVVNDRLDVVGDCLWPSAHGLPRVAQGEGLAGGSVLEFADVVCLGGVGQGLEISGVLPPW